MSVDDVYLKQFNFMSMRKHLFTHGGLIIIICFLGGLTTCMAQTGKTRPDKLYFRSGFGFSFPTNESNDYLSTKFSTSLGLILALGKGPLFLYPKLDLNAFGFDQLISDPEHQTLGKNGRATTYLVNMALGYRKSVGKIGYYGFLGAGGGMVLTPRVNVSEDGTIATMTNKASGMPIIETGIGLDYSLGNTQLFMEAGYLLGLSHLQGKSFQALPVNVGVKTNISRVFFK
jgi:hypothetical protein